MSSLNEVRLIGYVGKDPEIRHTQSGDAVASFSLATSEKWKTKAGQDQEHTEWHNVVAFGPLAKVAQSYVTKGKQLCVCGKIRTEAWKDKDGQARTTVKINASALILLGKRDDKEAASGDHDEDVPF